MSSLRSLIFRRESKGFVRKKSLFIVQLQWHTFGGFFSFVPLSRILKLEGKIVGEDYDDIGMTDY